MSVEDPTDLEAQERAREKQDEADRLKKLVEVDDLKWLMAHRQGRRIVRQLLDRCGPLQMVDGATEWQRGIVEGMRRCGLQLMADVQIHALDRYTEMVKEHNDDSKRKRSDTSSSDS